MLQVEYIELPLLQSYVKMAQWITMTNEQTDYVQKFLPYPFSMLSFHFKSAPSYSLDGIRYVQLPRAYFNFGYYSESEVYMKFGRNVDSILILLSPVSICNLFKLSLKEYKKALFLPAEEVLKERNGIIDELFSSDHSASSLADCLTRLLEPFSFHTDYKVEICRKSIELIYSQGGDVSLKHVAEECCVSLRTLERYFSNFLGITPVRYCQLVRLQKLIGGLESSDFSSSHKRDMSCSLYYDQSHLINNFKMITGETPGSFEKSRKRGLFDMEEILYKGM
jgi:AraC-like DNA-binding protein